MAVQSTLRYYSSESIQMPSNCTSQTFDSHLPKQHETLSTVTLHNDSLYQPAMNDGDEGWYCPNCGDGPYGDWQPSCAICQSSKNNATLPMDLDAIFDPWGEERNGPAPSDGNVVWYCCSCEDGPYSQWQPGCVNPNCTHPPGRCGRCLVEETK